MTSSIYPDDIIKRVKVSSTFYLLYKINLLCFFISVCDAKLKKCFYILFGESCASLNLTLVSLHSEIEQIALNIIIKSFWPLRDIMRSSGIFIGE